MSFFIWSLITDLTVFLLKGLNEMYEPHYHKINVMCLVKTYRNDPMFSDTWVRTNTADPDQTAHREAV